jgi:hypothetical protein
MKDALSERTIGELHADDLDQARLLRWEERPSGQSPRGQRQQDRRKRDRRRQHLRDRRKACQRQREHAKARADDGADAQLIGRVAADDQADGCRGAQQKERVPDLRSSQRSGRG